MPFYRLGQKTPIYSALAIMGIIRLEPCSLVSARKWLAWIPVIGRSKTGPAIHVSMLSETWTMFERLILETRAGASVVRTIGAIEARLAVIWARTVKTWFAVMVAWPSLKMLAGPAIRAPHFGPAVGASGAILHMIFEARAMFASLQFLAWLARPAVRTPKIWPLAIVHPVHIRMIAHGLAHFRRPAIWARLRQNIAAEGKSQNHGRCHTENGKTFDVHIKVPLLL